MRSSRSSPEREVGMIGKSEKQSEQRLKPVRVPWCISAATPFLKLCAAEEDAKNPTTVTFVGEFGLEYPVLEPGTARNSLKIVQAPIGHAESPSAGPVSGPYQLVRLIFDLGLWARFMHSFSDDEVIEEAKFDWSELLHLREAWKGGIEHRRRYYWELWKQNGICPDPNMYEVDGSLWL